MNSIENKCSRCVDDTGTVKNGKDRNGKQRYLCKGCGTTFVSFYYYYAYKSDINLWIKSLVKESAGIRSIARLLEISPTTVISRIKVIASTIYPPYISLNKSYEVDELCTFIGKKTRRRYIAYALRRDNGQVVRYAIGTRTKKHLRKVVDTLILSEARKIYTDRLKEYSLIIDNKIHSTTQYGTNHIERMNTTLRCHLKRLSRRTLAYSKSLSMLNACLTIYFWG